MIVWGTAALTRSSRDPSSSWSVDWNLWFCFGDWILVVERFAECSRQVWTHFLVYRVLYSVVNLLTAWARVDGLGPRSVVQVKPAVRRSVRRVILLE